MNLRLFLINTVYFVLVFVFALAIASLALTRRLNSYQSSRTPLILNVKKPEVIVTNSVPGRLEKLLVTPGQHVKKGEVLAQLVDDTFLSKLATLDQVAAENISARTEAKVLESQRPQFDIKAPRDGVIYSVTVAEGTYLNHTTPMMTLFADQDITILGYVNTEQNARIEHDKTLDVFSPRLSQVFSVSLEGAGRVIPATDHEASKYELQFRFTDPAEGAGFIQGEGLEVVSEARKNGVVTPAARLAQFWNSFIIGK